MLISVATNIKYVSTYIVYNTNNTNSKYETTTTTKRAETINTKHSQHTYAQTIPRKQHQYRGNEKLKGVGVTRNAPRWL